MLRLIIGLVFASGLGAVELPEGVRVAFAPDQDIEKEIVAAIDSAKAEILVSQYAITNPRIADALVRAYHGRKVVMALILDKSPAIKNYTTPIYFAQRGVPVVLTERPNNSRYMVIDRQVLMLGSCDWTRSMNGNHENLCFIQEPGLVQAYRRQFNRDLEMGNLAKP